MGVAEAELDAVDKMTMRVLQHGGHYRHPRHLLDEGTANMYNSYQCGPAHEDWIVFEVLEEAPFIPKDIVIRNYTNNSASIKKIAVGGGRNSDEFVEWIEIHGIHKWSEEQQKFPISADAKQLALREQFKFFKLRILENYGWSEGNAFYEFAVFGVRLG